MKILFLNGSPKSSGSASEVIINGLRKKLGDTNEHKTLSVLGLGREDFFAEIAGTSVMVVVFPLYVDGLPSHLLRFLYDVKDEIKQKRSDLMVFAIANNGFFEGKQNALALSMMQHFCVAAGIQWGQGLGIGGGGMTAVAPLGAGPLKSIGIALDTLSANIQGETGGEDFFAQPNFPKFLYKLGGHSAWRHEAKRNGLKRNELYKRW